MASDSNSSMKLTEAGAIAFKVELPEDSDSSFIIEDETILVGKGNDLQDKNFNCEITYEMLFPNNGSNSEDNKKKLNSEFTKFIKNCSNIYDLHKLYRKCNKLSYEYSKLKTSLLELIHDINSDNNKIDYKPLSKMFIFKHNKELFLPIYTKILGKNYPYINHCYKIYTFRKMELKNRIIKLSDNKINNKNIYTLKCNADIDNVLNN